MKRLLLVLLCSTLFGYVSAQSTKAHFRSRYIDLAASLGVAQGSGAFSYLYNWRLGAKQKFEIGLGARLTSYFGSKKDFISSGPAKYTRSFTTPFLIFFAGQKEENFDTLTVQRPQINSLNAAINLGYQVTKKWYLGFNIDVVGFSFGKKSSSVFTSNGLTKADPSSTPVGFNVLLTGDHDKGSLNSELYLRYHLSSRWSIRALYQFLFVEYKGTSIEQRYSDGQANSLFRNKANTGGLGVSYFLR